MRKLRLPSQERTIALPSPFWHLHTHSKFSAGDALDSVETLVEQAASLGQPALAITDHGNMAGAVQLYKHAKKHGLLPFPGQEFYLKRDSRDKTAKRYHIGIVAFTTEGYEALVRLSTWSHTRQRFHHKPHVDFADFAEWHERGWTQGLALTTGCFFGMVTQALIERSPEDAAWLVKTLNQWFPHTYVELQHHGIDHDGIKDDDLVFHLSMVADSLGLPLVITQDAHYCYAGDKPQHETLKRLVSWGEDGDDAVFPGDCFHLANGSWVSSHYPIQLWGRGLQGLNDLVDKHSLVIPELETYHYNVPVVTVGDPLDELDRRVVSTMLTNPQIDTPAYQERAAEEMEVVAETNMAGYLMLNAQLCDWMRGQGIFYEARGSASGSLLCFLLGITQLDPIEEGLRYERFLSKDRTKPPDIDLDVEDQRRHEVIAYLAHRFNVCQIGTWAEFSADPHTGRGSLFVAALSRMRKDGVDPKTLAQIKGLNDLHPDDQRKLHELSRMRPFKSYGTHAGGLVITSTRGEFERLVPTMLVASSDTTVTQYDMDDCEELGLLKEDILGQKSLSTLRRATELLGRSPLDGLDWIPLDDKETMRAIRNQRVAGVFQLEGWTQKRGCREMKPRNVDDLTVLVSIYRPATMETGVTDAYIRRRAGWESVPDRHQILMRRLKDTQGLPVFQDQVIAILRDIGFSPEDLTKFLKAVKASNENISNAAKVVQGYSDMFVDLATKAGFSNEDVRFTWSAIEGFAKYGFNKAHATTYARRSYRMAFLKTHHPLEFHAALLQTFAGKPEEKNYVLAAKEAGLSLLGPDVNVSGPTWSIDQRRGAIRKGLVSVKGVGEKAASEIARHAPYRDIEDIIDKCDARAVTGGKSYRRDGSLNGVLGALRDAKALKSVGG